MSDKPKLSSFETAFDNLIHSVMITQNNKIVFCNKVLLDISGYTFDELKEMNILDLVHDEDKELIIQRMKMLAAGEKPPKIFQMRFVHKDGSISLASVTADDIEFNGKPARINIGVNISADPLTDQSSELVNSLIDALSHRSELGFWVDDLADHTVYINDQLCKVLGFDFEEIREKSVTDFLHPTSQETYHQRIKDREEGKETSSYELILIDRLGRPYTFRVIGSILVDDQDKPIGSVGFFANIEPMKKLSNIVSTLNKYALYSRYKDLSAFWKNVLEDLLEIFYSDYGMIFLDGEVVARQGEFKSDFSPQETLEDLTVKGEVVSCIDRDCTNFFEDAKSVLLATVFLNQLPAGFILIGSKVQDLYLPQDVDLYMTFCNQITMNYEHHFLCIESEEEREFVSILLDILSHDFLNANTSVHGYLELLKQNLDTIDIGKFTEYVGRSLNVVERSERILQTVQQLSKIQQERKGRRLIALVPTLENAIEIQKTVFYPRPVNISFDCPKKINVVAGDLLQNVFENIINNAVKYTSREEVKIEIKCEPIAIEDQRFVEIRVTDYGMGIPDDVKPKFFQRLTRGDHRFHEGAGLGLYLARVIVGSYNGNIRFENRVPDDHTKGTIVVLQIPEG
ncbi:MAG: PAS domain-containing sensor histidine kinase [Candidatus Heimdallarchaeaceae archaeon]|jgi:PAS domain S-box-containing protein